MKKIITFLLLLCLCFGCQQGNTNNKINNDHLSIEKEEIHIISITLKEENKNFILKDQQSITTIVQILSSAIKEDGIVDIAEPEVFIDIIYQDDRTEQFYMWLNGSGTIMDSYDSHTTYSLSVEMTTKFKDLLK